MTFRERKDWMVRILETPEEVRTAAYLASYRPQTLRTDWQANLGPDVPLNHVSLPGTHDTCSFYGGDMRRTQSWPLDLQLAAGIRLIDMRPRYAFDSLPIHHENNYQETNLRAELQRMSDFLAAHPDEFVVMNHRREYNEEGNTLADDFNSRVFAAVSSVMGNDASGKPRYVYSQRGAPPLVRDVRGKLVVIAVEDQSAKNGPAVNIDLERMQNDYDVDLAAGQARKKREAEDLFTHWPPSRVGGYFMNFMSASSGGGYPNAQANYMNYWLLDKLGEKEANGKRKLRGVGLLLMDFPSELLIEKIIDLNFL